MIDLVSMINTDPFLLFFGSFYLVLGLSLFFASKHWMEFVKLFIEHEALSLILGILFLPISLSIIVFYNDWNTFGSTVLMVVGYIGALKSVVLLLRPEWIQNFLRHSLERQHLWLDGISGLVLGTIMLVM